MHRASNLLAPVFLTTALLLVSAANSHTGVARRLLQSWNEIPEKQKLKALLSSIDATRLASGQHKLSRDEVQKLENLVKDSNPLQRSDNFEERLAFAAVGQYWSEVGQALTNFWNNVLGITTTTEACSAQTSAQGRR